MFYRDLETTHEFIERLQKHPIETVSLGRSVPRDIKLLHLTFYRCFDRLMNYQRVSELI